MLNLAKLDKRVLPVYVDMSIATTDRQAFDNIDIEEVVLVIMIQGEAVVKNVIFILMQHGCPYAQDYTYGVIIITGVTYKHECAYVIIHLYLYPLLKP